MRFRSEWRTKMQDYKELLPYFQEKYIRIDLRPSYRKDQFPKYGYKLYDNSLTINHAATFLFICTIVYGIVIFTKDISLLLGSVFFLIYLPLWHLVAKRMHWLTKAIFYVIYGLSWASFIFSNLGDWFGWELDKLSLSPALFGWVCLLLGDQWAENLGKRKGKGLEKIIKKQLLHQD